MGERKQYGRQLHRWIHPWAVIKCFSRPSNYPWTQFSTDSALIEPVSSEEPEGMCMCKNRCVEMAVIRKNFFIFLITKWLGDLQANDHIGKDEKPDLFQQKVIR